MSENRYHNFLNIKDKIKKVIRPRFSFHYISYGILISFIAFSIVGIVTATTPNPGHPWAEVGDGVFAVTNNQTATRTYTFPDANATVLTTANLVTIAQGGTNASSFTGNGVVVANAGGTALTSVINATGSTLCLTQVSSGTPTWGTCGGVTDGDKGDIVVSGSGSTWDIDADVIDWADIADSMTLDATTNVALNGNTLRFNGAANNFLEITPTSIWHSNYVSATNLSTFSSSIAGGLDWKVIYGTGNQSKFNANDGSIIMSSSKGGKLGSIDWYYTSGWYFSETDGKYAFDLVNNSSNRLVGQASSTGGIGYVTLGAGLTLSGGVLNTSGTVPTPISSLTAAGATNTINNANYAQEWQWNTLAGNTGLKLSSNSTAAAGNAQKLFEVSLSGANGTAGQTTYGGYFSNAHTGAGTNVGLYATATGGATNYAIHSDGTLRLVDVDIQRIGTSSISIGGSAPSVSYSLLFGTTAGLNATAASYSNFLGYRAGNTAANASQSNFLGREAGYTASGASNSNFFGHQSGLGATNSTNSNFFGQYAGSGATDAIHSNFIGTGAGGDSPSSSYSNFLGYNAGNFASSSSYSNFLGYNAGNFGDASYSNFFGYDAGSSSTSDYSNIFGYQAGKWFTGNSIGANNVIIGTNISLPNATANGINIGGVLFGSGTYSTTTGNPSITAVSTGKIGIGIVSPAYRLDVLNANTAQTATNRVANFSNTGSTFDLTGGSLASYAGYFSSTSTTGGNDYDPNKLTNIGLYATASGGDYNYAAIFDAGNVGIGDTTPSALLTVGSGDLFQVNDSGNILGVFANATTDTDKFLVSDSGTIKYRTGAELLSDIGAAASSGSTAYIQNQNASAQTSSNFWISGNGRMDGTLQVGTLTISGTATNQIAIGGTTTGNSSIALGTSSTAGLQAIAIGEGATAVQGSLAIGRAATTTAVGQAVFGGLYDPYSDIYFGRGVTNGTPSNITIQSNGGSGTDIAGGNISIAGGKATGNAAGGYISFLTSDVLTSGATLQSLSEKARINTSGELQIGSTSDLGDYKLQVNGNARINGLDIGNIASMLQVTGNIGAGMYFKNTHATGPTYVSNYDWSLGVLSNGVTVSNNSLALQRLLMTGSTINTENGYGYNYGLTIGADGTNAMKIHTGGNITLQTGGTYTDNGYKLEVISSQTGQTISDRVANFSNAGATFDTTAGALTSYGGYLSSTSTRSAGANNLTNVGLYATASGAQNNYAAIFENGNVGIGTTTPYSKLSFGSGSPNINQRIALYESTGIGNYFYGIGMANPSGSNYGLGLWGGSDISQPTNTNMDMYIDSATGYVGIGTSAPAQRLTVGATAAVSGTGSQTNISAFAGGGIQIRATDAGASSQDALTYYSSSGGGGAAIAFGRGASWDTFMSFYTNNTASTGAISEAMRINNNQELMIGSTSDIGDYKLQVTGASYLTSGLTAATSSGQVQFGSTTNGGTQLTVALKQSSNLSSGWLFGYDAYNSNNLYLYGYENSGFTIYTNGSSRLSISSTGVVNISNLSASSAVYTDGSKNLTTTAPTSGTIGYWSRTGTTLSPATANDLVSVSTNSTTAGNKAIEGLQTGATTGTDYAGYFSNTGAATTNVGLYATATGGTTNRAIQTGGGDIYFDLGTTDKFELIRSGSSGTGVSYSAVDYTLNSYQFTSQNFNTYGGGFSRFSGGYLQFYNGTYIQPLSQSLVVSRIDTGQSVSGRVFEVQNSGATFNTTAGALTSYGGYLSSTSTRSAGANNLTNVGLYATASGAQNNYAAIFENGNVGIGTATPITKLVVEDDSNAPINIATFSNKNTGSSVQNRVQFLTGSDTGAGLAKGMVLFTITPLNPTPASGWADYEARRLAFFTGTTAGTASERLTISNAGFVNVGGNTTPTNLFSVGSTSQFQVNSSGAIAAATGITSSGTITFSGISGSTQCLQVNSSGVVSGTGSACGSGGSSSWNGITNPTGNQSLTFGTNTSSWTSTLTTGTFLGVTADSLTTGTVLGISSASTALTSGGLFNITHSGVPVASWTGDLAKIESTGASTANLNGNLLKLGYTGTAGASDGTVLNLTSTQTGTSSYLFRANDDGTYTDSTPFVIDASGNVGIGTATTTHKFTISTDNTVVAYFERPSAPAAVRTLMIGNAGYFGANEIGLYGGGDEPLAVLDSNGVYHYSTDISYNPIADTVGITADISIDKAGAGLLLSDGATGSGLFSNNAGEAIAVIDTDADIMFKYANNSLIFNNSSNEATFFGVEVGIGDGTPDNLFDVHSATANASLAITSLGTDTDPFIKFELADGTPTFTLGVDDSDSDKFKISTTALGTSDRFTIDASGNITLGVIANETTDVDKFLVSNAGTIKYRTGAELLSDIGAQVAGSYANTALSNLASVAINTSLISDTNNTDDLGSDAIRWKDLYLGPNTLHIGTATADEGTISYNTTSNILTLGSTGTVAITPLSSNGIVTTSGGTGALSVTATTGSGSVVLATSPVLVTPTLGTPVSGDFSTGTFTWPTFNQNTTGTASKATNLVGGNNTTLLGAMPYQSNTDTTTLLAPNTLASKRFLTMTGTGTNGAAPSWGTIAASDITGSALTKTDDTNVTLTLGGSASSALLNAASLTLGWTGTLSGTRGGTGVNNGTNTITLGGNISTAGAFTTSGAFGITLTATNTTSVTLPTSGTLVSSVTTANGVSATNSAGALSFTLGAITPTTVNGLTLTSNATGFSIAGGTTSKTLTVSNSLTLAGTDSTTMTFPSTSATIARTDAGQTFTGTQTFSSAPTFSSISGSTQCLQVNSSGVVSGTGSACGAGGGGLTVGTTAITSGGVNRVLFENGSNILSESANFTYDGTTLGITTASTTASNKALNISQTGATSGTDYAGYFSNTGAATTNVALYATASGGTTNLGLNVDQGQTLLGGTTLSTGTLAKLNIVSTMSSNGSTTAIAGIHGDYTFNNGGTAGYVQVGNRFVFNNAPTTNSNTMVGEIIRTVDNTTLANLVRGIEIVSNAGSNTAGTNTGLRSTGATFGVQAITSGGAGGVSLPAGLYAENTGTTQGNVARFYTGSMTSAPSMLDVYHDTSTFTGTGLLMDMAVSTGTFSGNFTEFKNASVTKFKVTSAGVVSMGLSGTASTNAVCSSLANATAPTAGTAYEIRDCNAAPAADYAEMYPVESGVEFGDIVATGNEIVNTYDTTDGNVDWTKVKGKITRLVKSTKGYQNNIIGIVVDNYGDFTSAGHNIKDTDNPMPVALNGRVPVKIASSSLSIEPGDYITTSNELGKGTKATKGGFVIGKALESWSPNSGSSTVMIYVEQGFYDGQSLSVFAGLSTASDVFAREILHKFLYNQQYSDSGSEIILDRLAVGVEIITPKVVADEVVLNNITSESNGDIGLIIGVNGKLTIKTSTSQQNPAIMFDSLGNATFTGTISAKDIKVGDISGIEDIANQINNLSEGQQAFALTAQVINTLTQALTLAQSDIVKIQNDLSNTQKIVAGLVTSGLDSDTKLKIIESLFSRDTEGNIIGFNINTLNISGDSSFTGKAQFDGLSFFSNTASFAGGVVFGGQPEFSVPPLYNKDSAGYALIKQGDKKVQIVFNQAYIATPVVNTSITFESEDSIDDVVANTLFNDDIRFIVVNKSQNGFTILLNKPATRDIRFSWNALSVKEPKVFESIFEGLIIEQEPTVVPIETQSETPNDINNNIQNTEILPIENSVTNESDSTNIAPIQDENQNQIQEQVSEQVI